MSKRYGRNQKRRARERIGDLERASAMLTLERGRLIERLIEQERHCREIAETINEVVQHSALLPPQKLGLDLHGSNPARLRLTPRRRRSLASQREASFSILELDLWLLKATLEENILAFERTVHVLLPGASGIEYRITADVARQVSLLPEVARQIYNEVVQAMRQP